MTPRRRSLALLATGGLLTALVAAELSCHMPGAIDLEADNRLEIFVALEALGALIYFAAVALVRSGPLPGRAVWVVLTLGALMRVLPLVNPPFLSSDLFRYVWDGRVQAQGINPYRYLPAAPELAFLRDKAIYENTNRSEEAPTIYPPAAQLIFAAIGQAWSSVYGVKLAMLLFEAVAVAALLPLLRQAGLPGAQVLIYAWNPLPVWEFAGNGHVDAASIGLLALAWLAASHGRRGLAGAALGLAILCKFLPAAVFPAFWRRWDLRMLGAMVAVMAALYAVYAGVGWRVLGFLPGYASEEGLESGSGFFLLRLAALAGPLPAWVARALPSAPGLRVVAIGQPAAILAVATMVVISPHYPWYLAWLALFACAAPYRSVIYLSASGVLLYLDPFHRDLIYPAFVYGPCILLGVWDVATAIQARRAA